MPSDRPSELIRWFQNMQRRFDWLGQTADHQKELHDDGREPGP
jgi:hypothetical protein